MTQVQKEQLRKMRKNNLSYSQIATSLGVSENTVKSFCRRNKLGSPTQNILKSEKLSVCKQCDKPLTQCTKGQPKKFCSEECRRKWWKANDSQLNKKAYYPLTCTGCGNEFESYGNKDRKFCCHACYITNKYKGASQ